MDELVLICAQHWVSTQSEVFVSRPNRSLPDDNIFSLPYRAPQSSSSHVLEETIIML